MRPHVILNSGADRTCDLLRIDKFLYLSYLYFVQPICHLCGHQLILRMAESLTSLLE